MRDKLSWIGKWYVEHLGRQWEIFNKITDAGLDWYLNLWRGVGQPGFKYIALGTSSRPVDYTDTRLDSEQIRKPITEFILARPKLESIVTFIDTEANYHIQEIGLFAGDTANGNPNTGILVARSVVSIDKTSLGSLKIRREDTLGREN